MPLLQGIPTPPESAAPSSVHKLNADRAGENEVTRSVTRGAVSAAAGTQLLIGTGAVVLGILALLNFAPLVPTLASLLGLGLASLVSGSAVAGRVLSAFAG